MGHINVIDVAKIFSTSQSVNTLDNIKRNSVAFRRLFAMCVGLHLVPKGMNAPNRRSVMNEISRAYGFADYDQVENSPESALEVFKSPLKGAFEVSWTKALKNSNYTFSDKDIKSANFLCNKIFNFVLAKGVDFDDFDTFMNFRPLPVDTFKVAIHNKEYSQNILNSDNLYWEVVIASASQHAVDHKAFNPKELSMDISCSESGDFVGIDKNFVNLMNKCPNNLYGGRLEFDQERGKIKFYFSKKLLSRIRYKVQRKSFLEVLGLANIGSPTFATS